MKVVERGLSFLKYWYFRYTLVTELYMVEKWEQNFIHIFMMVMFMLLLFFNFKVLLPAATNLLAFQ